MAVPTGSVKRGIIVSTNARIIGVAAAASFVVVFCLVSSLTMVGQLAYQNRVLGAKHQALAQLKKDLNARTSLANAYQQFVSGTTNMIGGSPTGTGPRDGDNGKIVLDALPSKYDFPGLTSSIEGMLLAQGVQIQSISGTDDEVAQAANPPSGNPSPVAMPFQAVVSGNYPSIQHVINAFESSIRPIQVQTLEISGNQSQLTLNVSAQTFYQPEKIFSIGSKVVK